MSVERMTTSPECMECFPEATYSFLNLVDDKGSYGHAAIAERGDDLELHLTLHRWGPSTRRTVARDLDWFKEEAKRLGKQRLLGVRVGTDKGYDPNLFRFAKLYGFTDCMVLQTMALNVDGPARP